jgi:hypothetical protein
MMRGIACFGILIWLAAPPTAAGVELPTPIALVVDGVACDECAAALGASLARGGVKLDEPLRPGEQDKPVEVSGEMDLLLDLSRMARFVQRTETPHKEAHPPGVSFTLYYRPDSRFNLAEGARKVVAALKGVDPAESEVDGEQGVILLKLNGRDVLTMEQLIDAFDDEGIGIDTRPLPTLADIAGRASVIQQRLIQLDKDLREGGDLVNVFGQLDTERRRLEAELSALQRIARDMARLEKKPPAEQP